MNTLKRRHFLAAAASAPVITQIKANAQTKTLKCGVIGCGWYGIVDLKAAWKVGGVECIAVCDVDSQHLKSAADLVEKEQGSRPKEFKDYEDLLNVSGLDFVIIGSPPHWHALQFIAACNKGLHIYCEKPFAYDIREGQTMVKAAKETGNIVQVGFQRRQSPAFQQVKEYISSGKPGKIIQVDAQIHYTAGVDDNTPQDPPPSLDWDQWVGPARYQPYNPNIGHFKWRLEKEYGNGHLIDWGIHLIDSTRMILDLGMPQTIQAAGGIYHLKGKITTPDTLTAQFDFEKCPVVWRHRLWGSTEYNPETNNGIFFYGEKETVFTTDNKWIVIPKGKDNERIEHNASGDLATNHMREFIDALRQNKQPNCTPQSGYESTSTVQLGMIAYETKSQVRWSDSSQEIEANAEAKERMKREYRKPWNHPYRS